MTQATPLVFLKLGGSLITDKTRPFTARRDIIDQIAQEIALVWHKPTALRLLIGHGSGSFGHAAAQPHQTQNGVRTEADWLAFAEVWAAARQLNQIVIESLRAAQLPIIAFPPSACVMTQDRRIETWDLTPLNRALTLGLIPVVQGDVVFDSALGGTILSTEQVFVYVSGKLRPDRILLAGAEPGVYREANGQKNVVQSITPHNISQIHPALSGSHAADVTGGMLAKVELMLKLVEDDPSLEVDIFAGGEPGNIARALEGDHFGTRVSC